MESVTVALDWLDSVETGLTRFCVSCRDERVNTLLIGQSDDEKGYFLCISGKRVNVHLN